MSAVVENWLKLGGLPSPNGVRADGYRWRVDFAPEHELPEIWISLAPSGPVWGPDHALAGLRLAKAHGVPAPRDARLLQRASRMVFASTAFDGPSGWALLQGEDPSAPQRVVKGLASCLKSLREMRFERAAELPGYSGFVEGPHASIGSRARVIADYLTSIGRDRGDETTALVEVCAACPPPPVFGLVHGRLDPGAVHFTPAGPVLDDWYWSHIGDPLEDWAAALILQPAVLLQLMEQASLPLDEVDLIPRLRASAALFALTHPEHPVAPALVRIALTDGAVAQVIGGKWVAKPSDQSEVDSIQSALQFRLARGPVLSGVHLDAWVCAASLWSLGRAGFIEPVLTRLGTEQADRVGGSAVLHTVHSDVAAVTHPLRGLVHEVLGSEAPQAARVGAGLLLSCALQPPVEGVVGSLLVDLGLAVEEEPEALQRVVSTAKDLGLWGQSGDLTHTIELLEVVDGIAPHQRWLPYVLWCLMRLGERGQSLDPGMVQRLFGTLSIGR